MTRLQDIAKHRTLLLMLLPAMAFLVVFSYVPMYGVLLAFKEYNFSVGILRSPWVGLAYIRRVLSLTQNINAALRNTLIISTLSMLFGFPAPIIFALLLNEIRLLRFKSVVQTISYLPYFLSWVVVSVLVINVFAVNSGIINVALRAVGLAPIAFLYSDGWFLFILVFSSIWKGVGWGSVIYLASIAGINPELYDSALVDGASRFQSALHITIPSLAPVVSIFLILNAGGLLGSNFEQIYNLMNPAVMSVADVIDTYIYRQGIQNFQYSFTTAVGLLRNLISFALIVVSNIVAKRMTEYAIW